MTVRKTTTTRYCVTLLLIPLTLLSQGAWPAHAHGDEVGVQHWGRLLTLHVHADSLVGKSVHPHGGTRCQHESGIDLSDARVDDGTLPDTHDSDAAYLSATDSVAGRAAPTLNNDGPASLAAEGEVDRVTPISRTADVQPGTVEPTRTDPWPPAVRSAGQMARRSSHASARVCWS